VKRIQEKSQPLTAAGLHALRDEHIRTSEPARALASETLKLERLPDAECGVQNAECCDDLTPAEVALMWQTAPPRMPIPPAAR